MDIYFIITITALAFIGYKLRQIVAFYVQREKSDKVEKIQNQKHNSTINPLFTEEEIARKKQTSEDWQKHVERYFHELLKKEKKEVETHQKSGNNKLTFEPSEELLNIILHESLALVGRNNAKKDYQKMIESNIAILNGEAIEKVEKIYESQICEIPYDNLNIIYSADAWVREKALRDMYDDYLKHRKEYWRDSWDYIVKKEVQDIDE